MYDYTQDKLSLASGCHTCWLTESVCDTCAEERDAQLTDRAWEIVDDGNEVYRWTLSRKSDDPSGHDWIGAQTRQDNGKIRDEFLEPVSLLSDRFFDLDIEVPVGSTVCADCHYVCNSHIACPNCELVNN